jgi:hypothetical protein
MPQSGIFDNSVGIQEISLGSQLTFKNITLQNEWWVYFKPTNNEEANFQLQAWITLDSLPQSEIDSILAEEERLRQIQLKKEADEAAAREQARLAEIAKREEEERLAREELERIAAAKKAEEERIAKELAEKEAAEAAERERIAQ